MVATINIGVSQETVKELQGAIIAILKSGQDQATIQIALQALSKGCETNDTRVENCTFTGTK